MPLPSGIAIKIEFVPGSGTFTDVTADVDSDIGYTIQVGRSSPTGQAQRGTLTFTLTNVDGTYTPGVQVLKSGSPAPYFPNVATRRRVYVTAPSGSSYRFFGEISSWSPIVVDGALRQTAVVANDLTARTARVTMTGPLRTEMLSDSPLLFWPLTDPAGALTGAEQSGNNGPSLSIPDPSQTALVFGDNGPGVGDGPGVKFAPASQYVGETLQASGLNLVLGAYTVGTWVNFNAVPPAWNEGMLGLGNDFALGNGAAVWGGVSQVNYSFFNFDASWHYIAASRPAAGGAITLYVDGVARASTATSTATTAFNSLILGDAGTAGSGVFGGASPSGRILANMGFVAIYGSELTPARIAAHFTAGSGFAGETVDARVKRFLGYANVAPADMNIDASTVTCGTYPQAGKDVFTACQDMTATEGGGSVFYMFNGKYRFTGRHFRKPAAPTLTIDAEKDADGASYQPSVDDQNLVTSATVNRSGESGTLNVLTFEDTAASSTLGFTNVDIVSYTDSDTDAQNLAQSTVAGNSSPGYRFPKLGLDLYTAETNLEAALETVQIGTRIRGSNILPGLAPATQLDVYAEGWTETATTTTRSIVFDTSAADNPARGVWSDAAYGTWQLSPDAALNAAIAAVATTVVIKNPTGPTFTTAAGAYPLKITVGAERLQLNSAPSGSSSPQTFTGVTRHVDGTSASAQVINAPVTIWPEATFSL